MPKLSDFEFKVGSRIFKPIVVGGMGVDISTSELALGAAKLGGVGHISDAMAPYVADKKFRARYQNSKRKRFEKLHILDQSVHPKWLPDEVHEATVRHVESTMTEKKGDGGIFINVMEKLQMGNPLETLEARIRGALDGGIDGITLSAGLHTSSLRMVEDHPRFRDALFGIIVSSARALRIFLRSAARVNRMPDYIVVEGPLAGGHLGFGTDWREHDLKSIVRDVVALLKKEDLKIPVVPAGGVFTGSNAVDMISLGASAVQVATRFTISQECGLPRNVKQEYLRANEEDVEVNCSSPTGYLMRMLKSSPSLSSNVKPNCEALGYILDGAGKCQYIDAYEKAPVDTNGKKLPITEKMCICYQFMRYDCWTCGHYVYRLKETTFKLDDGEYYLPPMEDVFNDYMESEDYLIELPRPLPNVANGARNEEKVATQSSNAQPVLVVG